MSLLSLALVFCLLDPTAFASDQTLPANTRFDVAFSPKNGALDTILKGIESAQKKILVAAYSFTSKPVSLALLAAHQRGVEVKIVADEKGNRNRYTAVKFLANHDIPVKLNGRYAIMHHKFMIIDDESVQLGSFNYSAAAENKNAENVLLLWKVKPLADRYAQEWTRLWNEATPLEKVY